METPQELPLVDTSNKYRGPARGKVEVYNTDALKSLAELVAAQDAADAEQTASWLERFRQRFRG